MAALTSCPVCHTPISTTKTSHDFERDMPPVTVLACGHTLVLESGSWGNITSSTAAAHNPQFIVKMKKKGLL